MAGPAHAGTAEPKARGRGAVRAGPVLDSDTEGFGVSLPTPKCPREDDMAKRATLAIVAVALAAGTLTIANAQVITHRDVGVRMGLVVAVAALDQCEAQGNHVSVAVVDRAGRLRVFLQSDRANPHNLELARRKAYTARTFGRSSADWAKRTAEVPELAAQRELADVIALRGGVPIKIGDETIGAVGVSGASSEGDEKCALAGVAKVADQLK